MLRSLARNFSHPLLARRGFTLTELAIVLGIIGIVLGGIWVAAARVYANNKTQKAAAQILAIANGYKVLYSNGIDNATMWADVTCIGVNNGIFPTDMLPNAACATDGAAISPPGSSSGEPTYPQTPWGGSSYVTVQTVQSNNTVLVGYWNLSQAACISLAEIVYNSNPEMTYQYLGSPATSNWLPPYGPSPAWTTPSQIRAKCGATNNNSVQVGIGAR